MSLRRFYAPAQSSVRARTLRHSLTRIHVAASRRLCEERGDVPGWVLITLMSAGLVLLLWGVAGDALVNMFQNAMNRVGVIGS